MDLTSKQNNVHIGHSSHLHKYANTTRWMTLDIGVATVEEPYNFQDVTFKIYCSYIPAAIEINYNTNLDKKIGTSVVALGWGRTRGSRTRDLVDRNSESLREVSIVIQNKEDCLKKYRGNGLSVLIDKFMICTHGKGLLDGEGYVIEELDKSIYNICASVRRPYPDQCKGYDDTVSANRRMPMSSRIQYRTSGINYERKINETDVSAKTRRQGICQNDHGGPLVTWVGTTELLIGVAVNGLYDKEYNCIGPYIFASTSAASQILKCLLSVNASAIKSCSQEATGGFDIYENMTEEYKPVDRALLRAQNEEMAGIKTDYEDLSAIEEVVAI